MRGSLAQYLGRDYLFGLAQYKFLRDDDRWSIMSLMRAASSLGHEEATWLLSLFGDGGQLIEARSFRALHKWKLQLFVGDPSRKEYAESAASLGDRIGQYVLSTILERQKDTDGFVVYLNRSVDQGFLLALERLVNYCNTGLIPKVDPVELRLRAAKLGHPLHARGLIWSYRHGDGGFKKDLVQASKWLARSLISFEDNGANNYLDKFLDDNLINLNHVHDKRGIEVVFTIGRELDGYSELFGPFAHRKNRKAANKIIGIYGKIMVGIRRSTLFTLHILRPLLGRDVATLIAKRVYATRNNPYAWYRP